MQSIWENNQYPQGPFSFFSFPPKPSMVANPGDLEAPFSPMAAQGSVDPIDMDEWIDFSQADVPSGQDDHLGQDMEQSFALFNDSDIVFGHNNALENQPSFFQEPLSKMEMEAVFFGGDDGMAFDAQISGDQGFTVTNNVVAPVPAPMPAQTFAPAVATTTTTLVAQSRPEGGFNCSSCRKIKPAQDFARNGEAPSEHNRYGTCMSCRQSKRSYYVPQGGVGSAEPRSERRSSSRPSRSPPHLDMVGSRKCSGCHKILEQEEFLDLSRAGRILQTCQKCRERKRESDRRKRVLRQQASRGSF